MVCIELVSSVMEVVVNLDELGSVSEECSSSDDSTTGDSVVDSDSAVELSYDELSEGVLVGSGVSLDISPDEAVVVSVSLSDDADVSWLLVVAVKLSVSQDPVGVVLSDVLLLGVITSLLNSESEENISENELGVVLSDSLLSSGVVVVRIVEDPDSDGVSWVTTLDSASGVVL